MLKGRGISFLNIALCAVFLEKISSHGSSKHLHSDGQVKLEPKVFIDTLFTKYGNGTIMTYEGFEHLMYGIELGNLIMEDTISAHHTKNKTGFILLHQDNHSHVVNIELLGIERRHVDHDHDHRNHDNHDHEYQKAHDPLQTCLSPKQILQVFGIDANNGITKRDFRKVCPALIFQLDQRRCLSEDILIRYYNFKDPKSVGKKAWTHGFLSIAIISVAGLLVVSTVPLLRKLCLGGILQFLIALAVGALTGDAILHLLPHAIVPEVETPAHDHVHDERKAHDHHENIYKGLCGLGSMYFFFLIGRIQTIISSKRTKQNNNENTQLPEYKEKLKEKEGVEFGDIQHECEVRVHHNVGHSHSHEHDHVVPNTISGMVWRVIVGDGLHNFSDGLAIGVAFANSTTGGISTSIAILCHELPHEMGDFALLLKKGVSTKRAILFNCLSSVLSCIGMVIGIAVGNIGAISLWVFVAIAGMFLYISLVDMIPELTTSTDGEQTWGRLIVQMFGLSVGTGIMFTIAFYEENLRNIVD